jgi:hypothetical protein
MSLSPKLCGRLRSGELQFQASPEGKKLDPILRERGGQGGREAGSGDDPIIRLWQEAKNRRIMIQAAPSKKSRTYF